MKAAHTPEHRLPTFRSAAMAGVLRRSGRILRSAQSGGEPVTLNQNLAAPARPRETTAKGTRLALAAIANVRPGATTPTDPAGRHAPAGVDPVRAASPSQTLKAPTVVAAALYRDGSVRVNWRPSADPSAFEVQRRLVDARGVGGAWDVVPGQASCRARDTGVPAAAATVFYRVRAVHRGEFSPWSETCSLQLMRHAKLHAVQFRMAA